MPGPPTRPGLREALAAFRYRNYTLFWVGALLSNSGSWIQNVTVPYVVFHLTGSAFWVGFAGFVQFLPVVVVGPIGGSIADRFHRRSVLLVTQSAQAAAAAVLAAVWAAGVRQVWVIVGLVALNGLIGGINIPSWQAFVSELVPREALLNAVTLNSTQFNAARAFGPALGGLVLGTAGPGWAFLANAASFLAVIGALLAIDVPRPGRERVGGAGVRREFARTLRYVRGCPGILACLVIVSALGALGSPVFQLLVVFADDVFGVGGVAYGLLAASLGVGSVLAAPLVAGPGSGIARSVLVTAAVVVYGTAITAFALAPVYLLGLLALLVAGGGYLALASTLNTTIQVQVDEDMRGKVLALYIMLLTASLPVGALVQGSLAHLVGPRLTVAAAGIAFLLICGWLRAGTGWVARMDDEAAASPQAGRDS
ncbi:MFS transporter [Rhabdothermincola sediminis]|uniref:MFS transporter n=1 Tax=Rhabdothermincola sediminis TaxID=2751370 RepID=UPI001AA08CF6|nr:MFS transporter [Rhabdothermincola sediminis]